MKIRVTGRFNRRAFLQVGSTSALGVLLAACSAPAAPQSSAPPPSAATAAAAPAATTAPAAKPAAAAPTTAAAAAPAAAAKPIKANLQFLFADGPPQKDKLESIVEKFKAKNPDAQVEVVWSPWGEFETKIVAMHSSGTPPDFHQIDDDAVPFFAMRDLLMPVDAVLKDHQVDQKEYHPMIWDLTTVQGKVMALTLALKPRAYIYNVDLFE
jgi:ABC-type glycerol-3-phosphate transport system substrate-binding protein